MHPRVLPHLILCACAALAGCEERAPATPSVAGTTPERAPDAPSAPRPEPGDESVAPKVKLGRIQTPESAKPGEVVNVKEHYENGQLATERSERLNPDGSFTRIGPMKAWFENGQLRVEGGYDSAGKLSGHWRYWNEEGQLLREGDYADGLREGDWVEFHANGQKHYQGFLHVGFNEGPWKYWHENGQPKAEGAYENNLREGPWLFWDERGVPDPIQSGLYKNHVRVK